MRVLLVVDLQKGFIDNESSIKVSNKIERLINNDKYDKVIFTKFVNKDNIMYDKYVKEYGNDKDWLGLKTKDEQDFSISLPKQGEVWEKSTYGLSDEDLQKIIDMQVESVDLCGLQTDACIYAIALQLFDKQIFPNILINFTATEPENFEPAKRILIKQFGKVDGRDL